MKRIAAAVLLLSSMSIAGCGCGTAVYELRITGQLVDAESGEAVAGAWIMALSHRSDIDDPRTIWWSQLIKQEDRRSATTPAKWSPSLSHCGWTRADGTFDIRVSLFTAGDPPRPRSGAGALLIEVSDEKRQAVDIEKSSGEWSTRGDGAEPWATWSVGQLEVR